VERYRAVGIDYVPGEKFVAMNKAGEYGCAQMGTSTPPRMSVRHPAALEVFTGTAHYGPRG